MVLNIRICNMKNLETDRRKNIYFTLMLIQYNRFDPRNNPTKHDQSVTRHPLNMLDDKIFEI